MFYDFNFKHATLMINISYKDLLLTLDHKYYDAGSLRIVSFFYFLGILSNMKESVNSSEAEGRWV